MSQTFRRALSNSGRDGKFWDIRNIVPSRGFICSFWFNRELHLPSHHARPHLGPPQWARPTPSRESMDVANEAEAGVSGAHSVRWSAKRALELAVKRIDVQQHQAHFRHTGIATLAYSSCGRKPMLTPE